MTKKEILEMTGLSEEEFYRQYPTEESWTESYKKGGWIQKATASIKRRGTEGVCTGSKFGGPTCRPGTKRYNLAKTFRKMAKSRKEEGGYVDMYEEGEDTNPLLNIPESQRFAPVSQRTVIYPEGYIQSKLNPGVPLNFMGQPFATGAVEQSISPLDLIGGVRGGVGLIKGLMKYGKAMKPNYIQIGDKLFDMGPHPKTVRRAVNQMNKGAQQLVLPTGFKEGGKIPDNVLRSRLESHMSPAEAQDYIDSYGEGGMVDAYQLMGMPTPEMYAMGGDVMIEDYARGGMIKRKDGSYSRRGLWDNIRANRGSGKKPTAEMLKQERKIRAAEKKEYGGMVNMYGMGGTTNIGDLSHVISAKNFPNMGYAMGGPVMYDFGSVVKDIGAGAYGVGAGMVNTLSMGLATPYTNKGYELLQDLGGSTEAEKRQQDSVKGYGTTAGAITMGFLNPLTASSAVKTGAEGLGQGISKGSPDSQLAQSMGTLLPMAGNAAGMVGGQMSVPSVPQAAMGGPINYPEGYQKNITFAMGGEPQEKEMTLKEKYQAYFKAKPVAKYTNFPRHPKVGIDPRGTVTGTVDEQGNPVQINIEGSEANWKLGNGDNFITVANDGGEIGTKKALAFYKNHDNIALAALMHNTAERKAKKEAAEEQAAMTAMDKFVAKYGGAVRRMYAKGGRVPMYDGGSTVLNTSAPSNYWSWGNFQPVLPLENPGVYASLPEFMGTSTIPGSSFGSTPTNPFDISLPLQPMQPRPIDPSSVKPAIPPASPQGVYTGPGSPYYNPGGSRMPAQTFDASNITGFDPGQYPNKVPYRIEAGESWPGTAASKTAGSPGAGGDMSNFGKYAETAAMLGPGLYNLGMGLFSKPEKFDKLKLSGQLKSYETPYQTDYAPYYATKYALRQAGQSSPAALSQLFATFSKQEAANRLANREQNLRRQMAADQFNLSRADQVAQANLAIDQLNAQQRAARRSMIGEGISNIGQVAAYNKGMRQDKDVLGDLYKNYEFKDGKWVYKG